MKKKLLAILLLCCSLFILMGCGGNPVIDYWNKFVDAVNNKDAEYISGCFGLSDDDKVKFMEEKADFYKSMPTLETKKIEIVADCNFSSTKYTNNYYQLAVEISVGGDVKEATVYMRQDNNGYLFCSDFDFVDGIEVGEGEEKEVVYGNLPDQLFSKSVYYKTGEYTYNFNPEKTEAYFVQLDKKVSSFEIPEEIDGVPVVGIQTYAFYQSNSILSFTISASKLKKVTLPETLKTIGDYAFHQCKKLTEITIPASVESIGVRCFAGCNKLNTVYFDVETSEVENGRTPQSEKTGSAFAITGGRNMLVGDIITLIADRPSVSWSAGSNASTVVSVDPDTGVIKAIGAGKATITAMDTATKEKATIDIEVKACPQGLSVNYDAFDRLSGLKAIYIKAINPNTIKIANGTQFSLNSKCKIYVPEESVEMYKQSSQWSSYANQIVGY